MNTLAIVLIIAAAAAFGVWLYFYLRDLNEKQRIWRSLDSNCGIGKQYSTFKKKYTKAGPRTIWSTVSIPADFLAGAVTGINNQFALYAERFPQWAKYSNVSEYDIVVVDPMATNEVNDPGSPAILVKGQQAAGTCLGVFNYDAVKRPYIVVPHQADSNWSHPQYWIDSIGNESQHVRLAENDYSRFLFYQGERDVHPIGFGNGYPGDK